MLDSLLRPGERVVETVAASPAYSDKTVFFQSMLAVTDQRVIEVSTPALSKLGIGRPTPSTVSVELRDVASCDFRQGNFLWKNGGKNLVVLQTSHGEVAWATPNARVGGSLADKIRAQL